MQERVWSRRARAGRLVAALCVLLAAVAVSATKPARADQADSAVGRVAAASITAGEDHTCALLVTGAVRCWGSGFYGQLGHDSPSNIGDDPTRPMQDADDVPLGGRATALAAGSIHTCALLTTQAVRCWGNGEVMGHGNLDNVGNGSGPSIKDAGDVPVGGKATAIAAGDVHTCALLTTGAVRCWGNGAKGKLGYGNTNNVGDGGGDLPIKKAGNVPLGGKATAIAAGYNHTCALLATGAVRCWGDGSDGQLGHGNPNNVGDGTGPSIKKAGDVRVGGKATAITAGFAHTCALLTTGAVRCWGYGFDGELGHNNVDNVGDGTGPSIKDAKDVPVGGKATAITAGDSHTCALLTTGAVRCWGYGVDGELGYSSPDNVGDGTGPSIKDAKDVPVGGKATAITAGDSHTCALLTTGAVRCWGIGTFGQLGHNRTANIGDDPARTIKDAKNVPVGGRVRIRATTRLSATVRPSRDRHAPFVYRVTGHVRGRFVADAATCNGQVKVTIRHGRRLLRAHTGRLHADCHYRVRTRLAATQVPTHRSTRLTIKIRYLGTSNLKPAATSRHARTD
jgi:alpha-tubulin suppressor-like RCC1 family protein